MRHINDLRTRLVRFILFGFILLLPTQIFAVGWTPTDAGLVVNLQYGDRFLLSVWVDKNGNGTEEDGEEFFVSNYTRYTGGYYSYGSGTYMKLLPATEITEMNEWQVGYPLDRGTKALGAKEGTVYTIWNDGKTLMTRDNFKFLGDLTSNYAEAKACDVVFVIPTERGVPDVTRDPKDKVKTPPSSFDPNNTLGRGTDPFNGRMGTGFLGMTYREVYMFDIPRANIPQSYTNAALVTFNTTLSTWKLTTSGAGDIAKGKAAYAYADSKHEATHRTLFRLYLLDDPINSCSSYFFATDEQDYINYRKTEDRLPSSQTAADSTAKRKIYTMDRMFCMNPADEEHCVQTDYMYVPELDSTYYYVGYNNTYIDDDEESMGTNDAHSEFTKIRELPILGLSSEFKAPAGAFGRMVADTTSASDNLNVKFKPAGYFCKISTGTNVQMRPNADSTIWTCDEMWHITDAYADLQIKATMFSGPEYSPTDAGIDIPGWSVFVTGNTVPLASDHNQHVTGGMDGWARIYANRSEQNGYMEFILANPTRHIHYDNNGLLGTQVPDQYPAEGQTSVTIEAPRLVNGFNFTGWTTNADGTGTTYQPGDPINLPEGTTKLYAQGSYTGTYHVAFSFEHSNGKRYFLTQPIGDIRYARARPVGDWTDTYQGMSDPYNTEPNYISTYKLIGGPDPCVECNTGEFLLDPRREWRYGAKDSLLFYSNFAPANDEYLGLYYENPATPFKDPVTVIANNSWAGIFTSTEGWPDYSVADVQNTKLKSEDYLDGFLESNIQRHTRTSVDSSFVKYNEELNQFDGVRTEGEATNFQISRVRVADEHYVVLPDTTSHIWRDTIEFGYHSGEQSRERVWTSMIGKHLLAVTKVGNDTVYFHPDPDHILNDPNNLYLDKNFRVSQGFEFIRDSRVSAVAEEDRATHETTSYHWHNDIVSGLNSPIDVKDGEGNYIDIVDTFRITMSHGGISKVKQYYGRWKKGARGLKVNGDGSVRTRDVIVRTKTYHYGETITHLVLKPEFKSYIFNPLAENSQVINFTLANVTAHRLLDVDGNPIGDEEVIDSEDITLSLALAPVACSFSSGSPSTYFNISEAVSQHVTLATKAVNKEVDNHDTLIISMNVTYGGEVYPVTARVPLVQTSLEGDELIWSVESGSKRYYIMAGTGGLIFRQYALKDGTLYKEGTSNTALIKGSQDPLNNDKQYITPWQFSYPSGSANQLALKTKYGVDRYFKMLGDEVGSTGGVAALDSSLLTFHYVDVLTNDNANEEELVKLQYGADKWLQFTLTGGIGAQLRLVNDEEDASVFSWSYLQQEYSLLNNGAYPSRDTVIFGYNTDMSVAIRTPYKAYKEYSMLVGNSMVNCCREEETDMSNLTAGGGEWKTTQTVSLIHDARTFDSGSTPSSATSGISYTTVGSTATTTVSTSGTPTSPTGVQIDGKYVNIVDTLHVTLTLQTGAPAYRFKGDWSDFRSVRDAELKIPLIRKTYHVDNYDSLVCVVDGDAYNHTFPNTITDPVSFTFTLGTEKHTGQHVLDVANMTIEVLDITKTNVTVSGGMNLNSAAMAEIQLVDEFGNTPTWCRISGKTATTITVECTQSGIRTPRMAYLRIFYIIVISDKMYVVTEQLTVSQPSLYQYANNQHLVHSPGASGDPLRADGMQQVHENKRILYYYPEQDVELPIRDYHFFGWWRWFREGAGEIGDSDIPEASWRKKPQNTGSGRSGSYNFPFRIIGDSVWVNEADHSQGKKLVTMGRYTVFHYRAADYNENKKNPPVKVARVAPPITTFGVADASKPTVTYAAEISNYYDHLPMSLKYKNQVDTAMLDTMTAIPEPTLSLREIFELHPWTEMADTLEHYKTRIPDGEGEHINKVFPLANEKYMEDHVMMAPTGNELLLSTEQRYILEHLQTTKQSESLLGYYMRDDHWSDFGWNAERKDTMIWCGGWDATCQWYTYNPKTQKYSICNHSTTVSDDFLKVPKKENITNGQDFDTVYYCLRAQSKSSPHAGTVGDLDDEEPANGIYMFNICRYKIIYHDTKKYGPLVETKDKAGNIKALITNDDIEQHYDVLERLNFDYNRPGSEYTIYPHPLPWADASYGYTYPETPDLPHNRLHVHSDFPNHGEYGLINRIPTASHWGDGVTSYWRPMEQHGGASNGYMIYCDGMSSSGQVAALSLETHLCAGQKMFFSGYVCNPSSQTGKADPNFTFTVQGSVNGRDWDNITSYTTGGIKPSSQWSQIYFPIVFNANIAYQHFRVRIYNVSSDWDGNDFIIDDMCIFATKPPLIAYQAQTTCNDYGHSDDETHVLLRVDYQGITGDGYNGDTVCYTVRQLSLPDSTYSFVRMTDKYLFEDSTGTSATDTLYGKLYIPTRTYEPTDADSIYRNMNDLLARFDTTLANHKADPSKPIVREGYIYEILEGDIRPVKYVVHSAKMNSKNDYTVHMSAVPGELLNSICGMTSYLKISSRMVLELNGEEQPETEQLGLCANATYDIGLVVKGSMYRDSIAPIDVQGSCVNDWLLYGDTARASSKKRYGYYYSDIKKVVTQILRQEEVPARRNRNQFATMLSEVDSAEMRAVKEHFNVELDTTAHPYNILADLVNKGFLILYKSKLTASVIKGDSVRYIIMPIVGSGSEELKAAHVEVCPNPILIKLKPSEDSGNVPMIVGGLNRDSTESTLPIIVLAGAASANNEIQLHVDSIMPDVGISTVKLRTTDDPDFQEGFHSLTWVPDLDYPRTEYYKKGNYITLHPADKNNYEMKPGYNYTFDINMQTILGKDTIRGGCKVGTVPFTVSIVPDYLRWDPKSKTNNQWNSPDNWMAIDEGDNQIEKADRFAPLASTNIIIPTLEDGMPYPVLPDLTVPASYDSVKQVNFTYNTCNTIRLMPGAALGQQQRMTFTDAIIDMSLPNEKWALRSAPVKGMISGDLFMAQAELNHETTPWEVASFDASGRSATTGNAAYWLSLYSSQSIHYGNDLKNDTVAASAAWAKVTNGMTLSLPPAAGWAVYTRTRSGSDAAVRLPKNDDIYYYYTRSGEISYDHYEHNLQAKRDEFAGGVGKAGELAFQPTAGSQSYTLTNGAESNLFVFGNPTLAYIDIWGFIADNAGLSAEFDYIDASGSYRTIAKEAVEGKDTITNQQRYLPPMHAIVLKATSGTSLEVTLNTSRVVTAAPTPLASPAPLRGHNGKSKGIMTITAINPADAICKSRLLLGQGYHRAIRDGEDAILTTVNIDNFISTAPSTPFNIYASEGNYGLSIDLRDEIVNVPVSFYMSDLPFDSVTHLWFTGVNNIDGPLVLYDAWTNTERRIIDGICLDIETPTENHLTRYYIRLQGYVPEEENQSEPVVTDVELFEMDGEEAVKIFQDGHVLILRNGEVYTMLGQKWERRVK